MTVPSGRRERKKAATRQKIADTALRLFLERGYEAVGIRDVAAEADVAVTTLFSHFASKEALVFERDDDFEQRLTRAATDRAPHEPLIPALRREVQALVRHCTADSAAPIWHMIEASPALREYEESMRLRHAESLATAIAADLDLSRTTTACRAIARFVIDAYSLAREAPGPQSAVDEVFRMIEAAWEAACPSVTSPGPP
ncbi:TetR/AcrR family transcriptional regulator [Streptomyces sp. NBC_00257]|uniref:TetR/AcrR family transcriptional regulator n=1 Tax=unclassified Streptomyces TaxID=2593676 RepID=UPI0022573222|nr:MULTISPECIES: TetR/AcrR family transcriptional regulator [unclassified Streptomyces]WTB59189.1 TetR/AcrR family transcriptional regulator [Streptomyces sp. NBC_00826]WTH87937.1 TetR/AcrR family transcriptional regulator [Streptomyces sp. NBC_00825]WTH96664.1 TetR/AcrR family transcriptional regulator [Streptomyces sp. NBC_00822]MCX4870144.1 TetR/AcrR family transcriptional regulator [Streptomyces sp. NBC_00906]MCX4901308.1 TetR/AcrR family transcriptional regulator [Streptomyces sp. NBC_008